VPDTPLTKKLRIQPGSRVLLLAPPEGYACLIDPLPAGASLATQSDEAHDVVQFFATTMVELRAGIKRAIDATVPGGTLWVCYPKKTSGLGDLSREAVWEGVKPTGWGPVTQIALDDVWSALRFRPEAEIKRTGSLGR
jgi:hypothetical protein